MSQYADTNWVKTEDDVREYIETGDDNVPTTPEELERLFAVVYDRTPDANDRQDGLWPLICAGISHA